jgi:hypothetical protein
VPFRKDIGLYLKQIPMSTIVSIQDWLDQHPENSEADKKLYLTEEQVRFFPKFKDATPEEIENIIGTLHDLALISYELYCREASENKSFSNAA